MEKKREEKIQGILIDFGSSQRVRSVAYLQGITATLPSICRCEFTVSLDL